MRTQEEQAPRATHLLLCRLCMTLVLVVLFPLSLRAHAPMMVTNVIYRTFLIRWGDDLGTAFTIDHASKQYLVTARHVVKGIKSGNVIKLFREGKWENLPVNVVGIGKEKDMDVAVLACSIRLSPSFPLVASLENLKIGQAVSFFGYPFGWGGGGEEINRGIPLPFVKAGIVSAMVFGDVSKIYLDAHNNEGFSGGPVVFTLNRRSKDRWRVAGIIVNYQTPVLRPIVDLKGEAIGGYIRENSGIAVAIHIRHVVELIDANPIGFTLPAE